ncbi:hypothetical protein ACM7HV_30135 [Pseudomonas paraeruginosa]|uniref:Uncharacterized protein n=1 Tax=Pseudomonas aeruginosa TaxID=287 RepID=A0ABD7JS36_PSEAI|nr:MULTISPECIES: hypothetical protein [Pseudomonas aeruginosa group]RTR89511.1 hypothetical protein DY932_32435 [Pseudomonas paraeruginosa]RTS39297.1 hypothetical protein DY940_32455 [Pseudomonas aeruginosa]
MNDRNLGQQFRNGTTAPWMLAAKGLRDDLPFFGAVGLICGLIQWVGYQYFDKANFGSELLQEHVAFNSLLLTVMFLWLAKGLVERLCITKECPRLKAFVAHVASRAVAFASVAAAVIAGFALAASLRGDFGHAFGFMFFATYFIALAEVAANPFFRPGHSRTYVVSIGIIIGMPWSVMLIG